MNFIEKKLAVVVLKMAADQFSRHGCNDFDLSEHLTAKERLEFLKRIHSYNGDPGEPKPKKTDKYTADWAVMSYLAAVIENEVIMAEEGLEE